MSDLFDDIAKNHVPEPPEFDDLPAKVWVLGVNTTSENGGAAPTVRKVGKTDQFQFNVGLICQGGEPSVVEAKYGGRFTFFSAWVFPHEEYDKPDAIISGRLAGFFNAVFSCGINPEDADERRVARWNHTIQVLKKVSEEKNLTIDHYTGITSDEKRQKALFLAGLAVAALENKSVPVLFKTKDKKPYENNEGVMVKGIEVGAVEDCAAENLAKRKVTAFESAGLDLEAQAPKPASF